MGRRAADHPTPVPVLGEPALVGTRVWRTMPFGTSSMATMTLVHHCNVGVQTSPKMRNQLQLDGKHTNEENITMQATKDPDINVDHRKEQTKSIIIKQRSLETKMKKGVTFEGLEKDFYKNIKNEKQHNNCSSLTLSAMANYIPKQKKSCFFTNGSVVDPEVMGGISSDISEGEEFSKGKKIPLPPRSPPERPPVMICSTCGGKQYPASAEIDNKTKKMAVSASAYSLGLQLRDSSPLYPGKDIQIESHNARSVTQSDLHPMSPNLHPYLSMNTNKEWPLSRLPAQQSEVSNLTNHHAVKRESSVDTNINQSSRSSALNAQTLTIPEKEDRGSFLNTHKAENSCPCIPPQIDSKTQGGSRTPQLKPTLQKTPNENPPARNLLALCDCSYLQTENAHKEPPSVYRQNSAKQISKSQNGETFCKPLNRKNSFSTCFSLNAKHQTEQSSLNEGIISTLASNSQRQIRHPRELESNVDQQNKESLSSHTDLSTKTSSKTQIRVDKESKCSPSESQLDAQKLHNDTSHASMHTDTHSPAGTHKKDSNISKQHKNTTGNSLEGIPSQTDASTHLHLKVKSDKRLFSHTPNMSTHPKAKLTKPTLHNQNISNALISTQTQVEVHLHTKESSQTSPRVKPVSYNVCVHSKTQRQQTEPAVFRHSVLNQLNNDSLESSLPAIASVRAFPQTKMHRGTEFNQWSDIESKKQGIVKEAQPLLKTTNSLVEPPIKPPPLMSTGGQPPKPSSAPPQEPTFKHIIGENHPNSDNSRNLVEHMDCITGAETILSDPSSRKHDHPVSALQLLPASPYFGNRRDSKNKLEMVEASLQSNKDRVTTLLNIIQDLEMNHALSKGRRCFQTGQDLSDCSTCQKTACAVYSVEYEFRQQEGRFKELLHSLCPHTMERTEEYEESLLTSLIQNHKLHRLKANLMSQVKPENQAQTVCKNQCQIQTPNQNPVTKSQNQTRSETKIQSHSQIQLQPQTSFSSQSEILSQILPPFPIMSQIQPQNQAQTHSQNQCLFKAKIKRKKLCRKLFGWLPHRVYLK